MKKKETIYIGIVWTFSLLKEQIH